MRKVAPMTRDPVAVELEATPVRRMARVSLLARFLAVGLVVGLLSLLVWEMAFHSSIGITDPIPNN